MTDKKGERGTGLCKQQAVCQDAVNRDTDKNLYGKQIDQDCEHCLGGFEDNFVSDITRD